MRIQYIGNFTDGTGWAKASTYNALALQSAGYDVYCKELKYNENKIILEEEIENLLLKESPTFDAVVHHVLPKDYRYIGGVKNIGFIALESIILSNIHWIKNLYMMDEIWVPNEASRNCLVNSGIEYEKIKILPHTFNYHRIVNSDNGANITALNNTFNFAFVGEFSKRKNLEALLRAFHNEFDYIEPVNLFIKTFSNMDILNAFRTDVRKRMKLGNRYKDEVMLCDYLPEDVLGAVLKQCHAFVMPSYGEAWCYPAMESMALGLPVIYTSGIGIEEYADNQSNFPVESQTAFCYGATDTLDDIYTSKDLWKEINVADLQMTMRKVFELYQTKHDEYKSISEKVKTSISKYDFRNPEIARGIL
jgi:glycosyltransferase involved in cell wall biosynthesis